ncbi:MAG: hypothetical protein HWN67_13855 [Candidatus Helarchaeota archaeon]|nr:hypothetical protein [Candidatus Helarchaeota archaeon]
MTKPIEEEEPKRNNRIQIDPIPDFIINVSEEFELNLNEEESINLIDRLNKGSNENAKQFLRNASKFYEEMRKKEELFKKKELI